MSDLLTCTHCKTYTLQQQCPTCKKTTVSAHYTFPQLPNAVQKEFTQR